MGGTCTSYYAYGDQRTICVSLFFFFLTLVSNSGPQAWCCFYPVSQLTSSQISTFWKVEIISTPLKLYILILLRILYMCSSSLTCGPSHFHWQESSVIQHIFCFHLFPRSPLLPLQTRNKPHSSSDASV